VGGLHIPQTAQRKPQWGTVVSVGPGISVPAVECPHCEKSPGDSGCAICYGRGVYPDTVPLDIKPGDRVYFDAYGAGEIELDGERLLIKAYYELLAVEECDGIRQG
jgi:co-chaperonin GroES (HSP10)